MKRQKMSLANILGKLSREEMKNIMAGDAPGEKNCNSTCDSSCSRNCGGVLTNGTCDINMGTGKCQCVTVC